MADSRAHLSCRIVLPADPSVPLLDAIYGESRDYVVHGETALVGVVICNPGYEIGDLEVWTSRFSAIQLAATLESVCIHVDLI